MLGVFTALLIGLFGSECVLHGMSTYYADAMLKQQRTGTLWSNGSVQNCLSQDMVKTHFQGCLVCNSPKQHSGYIHLPNGRKIFYVFFEASNNASQTPVSLWISGGPGLSSLFGAYNGIGPFIIVGRDSIQNPFSWTRDTHLLVLDQPIGTGFSRGKGRLNSISLAAADIYKALLIFFDMFPQYQNRSFHMFSESYGGHYLFKIASLILEPHPRKIQLSSIGIGNGLIDPRIQFKAYFKMVCRGEHQLLPTAVCETINRDLAAAYKKLNACYRTLNIKSCRRAWKVVGNAISFPHIDNHNPLYNITNFRFRMDENAIRTNSTEFFFNQHHVQVSLGVSNGNYKVINPEVYKALYNSGEIMVSLKGTLESLLDRGVRVLLYAGDTDFLYNWLGLQDLTEQLDWRGARGFRAQRLRHYFDNETKRVAWQLRAYLDLCFIRFHEAGHMAYLNSPRLVQRMVQLWLNDDLLKESI